MTLRAHERIHESWNLSIPSITADQQSSTHTVTAEFSATRPYLPAILGAIGPAKSGNYDWCEKSDGIICSLIFFSHLVISYFCAFSGPPTTMKDSISSRSFPRPDTKCPVEQESNFGMESSCPKKLLMTKFSSSMRVRFQPIYLRISQLLDHLLGSHSSKSISSTLCSMYDVFYRLSNQLLLEIAFFFWCDKIAYFEIIF